MNRVSQAIRVMPPGFHRFAFADQSLLRSIMYSPAVPVWLLVGGFFYYLIALHYLGIESSKTSSTVYFGAASVWLTMILLLRMRVMRLTQSDMAFLLFIAMLLGWGTIQWATGQGIYPYFKYLPSLVILPYLAGRLFNGNDVHIFLDMLALAAIAVIPLISFELYFAPSGSIRIWMFGHVHGVLLAGMMLAFGVIAMVGMLITRMQYADSSPRVLLWLVALMACSYLLPMTSARGSLLATIVAVLLLLFAGKTCDPMRRVLIGTVVGVPIILALMLNPHKAAFVSYGIQGVVNYEFNGTCAELFGDATHAGNSMAARVQLWMDSLMAIKSAPVAGVGPGNFEQFSCASYPHSTILHAWAELGVVGGLALLMLMAETARIYIYQSRSLQNYTSIANPWSLLGLFALVCLTDQIYGNYFQSGVFFLLCGIGGAISANMTSVRR